MPVKEVVTYYGKSKTQIKEQYTVLKNSPTVVHGTYISYYENGQVKVSGSYNNNQLSGNWKFYYENGNRKAEGVFMEGKRTGYWKFYYENGQLSNEGTLTEGKKDGVWKYYYESGMLKSTGTLLKDQKEDLWKYFNEEGKLSSKVIYSDTSAIYFEFYPSSGKLKSQGNMVNNKSNGQWVYFYENGNVKAEGKEVNGLREGMWKFYYPSGSMSSKGEFAEGEQEGSWAYYHENGQLSSEGVMISGTKEGAWKLYYETGEFKGEGKYIKGEGAYIEYYPNGNLKIDGYMKHDKSHGMWTYYSDDGHIEGKCFFVEGKGEYTGYFKDGITPRVRGNIENGRKTGTWELYNKKGDLTGYHKIVYNQDSTLIEPTTYQGLKLKKKKFRYFHTRPGEFRSVIVNANPTALLVRQFPISLEYYYQERLGFELKYTHFRDPLFKSELNIPNEELFSRGFSVDGKMKLYHKDTDKGMWYFGPEVRISVIDYKAKVVDSLTIPVERLTITTREHKYEFSLIVGTRFVSDAAHSGFTFDVYTGMGIGYRTLKRDWNDKNEGFSVVMDDLKTSKLTAPFRFGFMFGYVFKGNSRR